MALQGDLDSFALPDVLRLLAGTAKSGRLAVTGSTGDGQVWLDAGELVGGDATTAPRAQSTEDVVFELLRFTDGSFSFDDGERLVEAGHRVSVDDALGRAEALLAEWTEVETVVPAMDAWATLTTDLDGDGVHIDAHQWRVLAAIGGGRSATGIAIDLDLGDLTVCQGLKGLVELGVVTIGAAPLDEADSDPAASDADERDADSDAATDLALLSADSAPVVLESGDDALLPEPLPGAGTSYSDDYSATGVVDGRAERDGDRSPVMADVVDHEAPGVPSDAGWGTFDPSELADARSEHLAAAPETWNDGWADTPAGDDHQPASNGVEDDVVDADGADADADADAEGGSDESDRGSLLKFLSSVEP